MKFSYDTDALGVGTAKANINRMPSCKLTNCCGVILGDGSAHAIKGNTSAIGVIVFMEFLMRLCGVLNTYEDVLTVRLVHYCMCINYE